MRLVYCDAALENNAGHFASQCRSLRVAFRALGVPMLVLGHQRMDPTLAAELDAQAFFSTSPYARTSDDPLCGWLKSFADVSVRFSADFARIDGLGVDDIVYYDTCTPAPFMGLAAWAQSRFRPDTCPRIVASLIEHSGLVAEWLPDGSRRLVPGAPDTLLYRYASLCISDAYAARFRFVAYEGLAPAYAELTARRVVTVPHPYEATTQRRDRSKASPVRVAFIGAQRENKGFKLVPAIVRALLQRIRHVNVIVQNSWGAMAEEMAELAALAGREPRLEVIHESRDPTGWASLIERCDLLVAPYDRRQYAIACSGITFEGLANGIPVLVPTRTAMAGALRDYADAGLAFEDVTPEGVVAAIKQALAHYPELAARAQAARELWAQRNGPRRLAGAILQAAQAP